MQGHEVKVPIRALSSVHGSHVKVDCVRLSPTKPRLVNSAGIPNNPTAFLRCRRQVRAHRRLRRPAPVSTPHALHAAQSSQRPPAGVSVCRSCRALVLAGDAWTKSHMHSNKRTDRRKSTGVPTLGSRAGGPLALKLLCHLWLARARQRLLQAAGAGPRRGRWQGTSEVRSRRHPPWGTLGWAPKSQLHPEASPSPHLNLRLVALAVALPARHVALVHPAPACSRGGRSPAHQNALPKQGGSRLMAARPPARPLGASAEGIQPAAQRSPGPTLRGGPGLPQLLIRLLELWGCTPSQGRLHLRRRAGGQPEGRPQQALGAGCRHEAWAAARMRRGRSPVGRKQPGRAIHTSGVVCWAWWWCWP